MLNKRLVYIAFLDIDHDIFSNSQPDKPFQSSECFAPLILM